jgi:hypothetical protein
VQIMLFGQEPVKLGAFLVRKQPDGDTL